MYFHYVVFYFELLLVHVIQGLIYRNISNGNAIVGVRVYNNNISIISLREAYHEFEPWSVQANNYKIGVCCFSARARSLKGIEQSLIYSEPG